VRLAAGFLDLLDGGLERAGQPVIAFLERAGRAHHTAALGGEQTRDVGTDAAAGAGDEHDLAVQLGHA